MTVQILVDCLAPLLLAVTIMGTTISSLFILNQDWYYSLRPGWE